MLRQVTEPYTGWHENLPLPSVAHFLLLAAVVAVSRYGHPAGTFQGWTDSWPCSTRLLVLDMLEQLTSRC